ncbi:hypothetical protein GCM10027091_53940 [Streptomyces daliensis]
MREEAYTVAATVRSVEDYFTVLDSLGIQVKQCVGPESGEVTGYSLAAPGDTNAQGKPVWYGGSKLAPDLSINRLRERLSTQDVADSPRQMTDPADIWRRAEDAIRHSHHVLDTNADEVAQGHLDAFGDALHTMALATHGPHRGELRAAAQAFNRARRSTIRADHQAANELRQAAKELAHAPTEPGGTAIALLFATLHLARAAAKWHQQRHHEQQASAAEQTFRHLQDGYRQAAEPVLAELAQRAPSPATAHRFEHELRAALPDHAERIPVDPAWPALTTTLARAESAGHNPRRLLAEVGTRRELDTAERPAEVLNWRITAQLNNRAQAARMRSTHHPTAHTRAPARSAAATVKTEGRERRRRR